jgi:hypothetical protein
MTRLGVSWFQSRWRTIVIRCDYLHFVKKYNRFKKRHKTAPLTAHLSSVFELKLLLLLVNSDRSQRLSASTLFSSKSNTFKVTSRRFSFFFEEARNSEIDQFFRIRAQLFLSLAIKISLEIFYGYYWPFILF